MTILVAAIAVGVIYGVVRLLGSKSAPGADATTAALQQAAAKSDSSNPYAQYLEVTGIRISEDEKQHAQAHLMVVNHSTADLPDLELQVSISTTTAKAGDDPLAVVTIKTGGLPANGSKDIAAPLQTKVRAYEMPDWQFLRASFTIAGAH
ncbi:MAG: hypothetical protein P4K98_11730 [Bryobacteraceae bacterium]|nr:hypothetical protein [Bryobacteraceae bacterium]